MSNLLIIQDYVNFYPCNHRLRFRGLPRSHVHPLAHRDCCGFYQSSILKCKDHEYVRNHLPVHSRVKRGIFYLLPCQGNQEGRRIGQRTVRAGVPVRRRYVLHPHRGSRNQGVPHVQVHELRKRNHGLLQAMRHRDRLP